MLYSYLLCFILLFLLDILDALDERLACSNLSNHAGVLINCLASFLRKPVYLDSLIAETVDPDSVPQFLWNLAHLERLSLEVCVIVILI